MQVLSIFLCKFEILQVFKVFFEFETFRFYLRHLDTNYKINRLWDPWNLTKILARPVFLKDHSPPLLIAGSVLLSWQSFLNNKTTELAFLWITKCTPVVIFTPQFQLTFKNQIVHWSKSKLQRQRYGTKIIQFDYYFFHDLFVLVYSNY